MGISGSFTFNIRGTELDFDGIRQSLGIYPTRIIRKGQNASKALRKESKYDIWIYELKIVEGHDEFQELMLLLNELLPNAKYISELKNDCEEVVINCYFRSDFAQLGFGLSTELIALLHNIGVAINFHILSFGEVED